jgi:hypothetical protein
MSRPPFIRTGNAHGKLTHSDSSPFSFAEKWTATSVVALLLAFPLLDVVPLTPLAVVLFAFVPVIASSLLGPRSGRIIFWVTAIWIVAILLSNIVAEVPARETVEATAIPILFLLYAAGFLWLLRKTLAPPCLALGVASGWLLNELLFGYALQTENPWKYGLAPPLVLLSWTAVALLFARGRSTSALLALAPTLLASLALGFRSEAAIIGLSLVLCYVARRTSPLGRISIRRLVSTAAVAAVGTYLGYGLLASSGGLGDEAEYRWEVQSRVVGGVLVGARPELLVARHVAPKYIVVGRGTHFDSSIYEQARVLNDLGRLGLETGPDDQLFYFRGGTYLHSQLLQGWTEYGLLAVPGLLAPVVLLSYAWSRLTKRPDRVAVALLTYPMLRLGWDLLFSPTSRMWPVVAGFAVALAIWYVNDWRGPKGSRAED